MGGVTLDELRAELELLADLSGLDRARAARRLTTAQVQEVIGAAGDEGVWQATREKSYREVAAELGISYSNVNRAVTRHRRRSGL